MNDADSNAITEIRRQGLELAKMIYRGEATEEDVDLKLLAGALISYAIHNDKLSTTNVELAAKVENLETQLIGLEKP